MQRIDTVIIGGGQAGLAMSHSLASWGIDHVVLERGRVAERWRSQRWDSLRLLTPNWMSRLPGWSYQGSDPDGFMTAGEVVSYLRGYAATLPAPVLEGTSVMSVTTCGDGYLVLTDRGAWRARNVVVATGQCDRPHRPAFADRLPSSIHQLSPAHYKRPDQVAAGGVLVVGASASGLQLADELARAGRQVTLAVGRHTRLPRTYRGQDILWWLEMVGVLGQSTADAYDLERARRAPSLQLVGTAERTDLDLGVVRDRGVRLVGRALGAEGARVGFATDMADSIAAADRKLDRTMARIDDFIARYGLDHTLPPGPRPAPLDVEPGPAQLDLIAEGIDTVVWATGYRRRYPWLHVPVLDGRGEIRHRGGVTPAPGLFVLGLAFLRRRKSQFIDGVGDDARALAGHIAGRLAHHRRPMAA